MSARDGLAQLAARMAHQAQVAAALQTRSGAAVPMTKEIR